MNRDEKCPQWCQLKIPSEPVASRRPADTRSWPRVFHPEGLYSLAGGITTGFRGFRPTAPDGAGEASPSRRLAAWFLQLVRVRDGSGSLANRFHISPVYAAPAAGSRTLADATRCVVVVMRVKSLF